MRLARFACIVGVACGCHRTPSGAADAGAPAQVDAPASTEPGGWTTPIAAARLHGALVAAAGFAPGRGAIAVTGLADDGSRPWTTDVLDGIAGGPNTELKVFAAAGGAVVVYRGRKDDKAITQAVFVDDTGHAASFAVDAGPAACATDDALAWIEREKGGSSRVLSVPMSALGAPARPTPGELLTVPPDRDPSLVCGNKLIFVLGDGESDTTVTASGATTPRPRVILRDRDFSDEEREHDTFVAGDTLGLVRVGQSGAVSVREVGGATTTSDAGSAEIRAAGQTSPEAGGRAARAPSAWRRLGVKLAASDDVVAVDGDADDAFIVFTRDEDACDGPGGASVHAVHVSQAAAAPVTPSLSGASEAGDAPTDERSYDVAPAVCGRELGPFWTGVLRDTFVVGWVERASSRAPGDPPIVALAYRTLTKGALGELRRVDQTADELVDADCDKTRCYAVALVRSPGSAAGQAERVALITYP